MIIVILLVISIFFSPILFVIAWLLFLQAEVNDYYVKERQHLEKIKIKVGMIEQFDNYYFGENRFRPKNISFEILLNQFKKSFTDTRPHRAGK